MMRERGLEKVSRYFCLYKDKGPFTADLNLFFEKEAFYCSLKVNF